MVCEFNLSINTYLFFTTNKRPCNELATSQVVWPVQQRKTFKWLFIFTKRNNCQVALLVASALDNNGSMDNLYCAILTKSKYIK